MPETGNAEDRYAVTVLKGETVGHLPRQNSRLFWFFITRGGTVKCTVTGGRQHSHDVPQGGLDVPCSVTCVGTVALVKKLRRLLEL